MEYKPVEIEKKWQEHWQDQGTFTAPDDFKKEKFYGLIEFPYPSGDGLHVGHLRSSIAMDVISRKRRMEGFNVLYPIGMDAFGLPAENYAIKTNTPPQVTTKKNINNFNRQLKSTGYSFDWSRFFSTTDQGYYKWTQWIFLQMFKNGLAYKSKENINWCTKCKIGLANEEVVNGTCERCDGEVVKKEKEQWVLRITKYADRLIDDLDKIDFLDTIKKQQKDWIGKSEGAEIDFKVEDTILKVFTTRPDTLFGVTFMVLAPEHEIVVKLKDKITNYTEVKKYIDQAKTKSDIDRGKTKTGLELKGIKAINPVNNEEIPIFVADYVMTSYGTGAIMAVPAHDQRDFEFAQKYNLKIRNVIMPVSGEPHKDAEYRETISAVVQRKSDKKFLLVKWKKFDWVAPSIGGIDDRETPEQAAEREVFEETGYKVKAIKTLDIKTEEHFYADNKKVWRHRVDQPVLLELINEKDKPAEINKEEKSKHEVIWLSEAEALQQITHEYNKLGVLKYLDKYKAYSGQGRSINSGEFNGLLTKDFKKKIIKWLVKHNLGKETTNYKLRDWIFSRQRYWGEPIPMVYCEKCAKNKEQVLILHGWEGTSKGDFIPDLKKTLEAKGYEVFAFDAPNTKEPDFDVWYKFITKKIKENKLEDFHLIGHSMGGHLALKLAEEYSIKNLILIGSVGFKSSDKYFAQFKELSKEELVIFKKYQEHDLDITKVKDNTDNIYFLFGEKDPWITKEIRNYYIKHFNSIANINIFPNRGHFMASEGDTSVPEVNNIFEDKINMLGWVPVPEKNLPITLPGIADFKPTDTGESPLAKIDNWVKTTCPDCGGEARRETDVMPNWAGSNWYFIRYCDPKNNKQMIDAKKAKYWLPVDWYNGGMEHTNLHLLYSRFVYKFLYDIKAIPEECGDEPYKKRTAQGMILAGGGVKMSKSKGNVINPDEYIDKYGADTLRTYEMFMGPFDQAIAWDDKGVIGVHRFLNKVWNLYNKVKVNIKDEESNKLIHQTIEKVSTDIEDMHFNTAVAAVMILVNHLEKQKEISKDHFIVLLKLLSPFAPHMAEELWQLLGNKNSIAYEEWPIFDKKLAQEQMIKIGIQVNGKLRDEIELVFGSEVDDKLKQEILNRDKIKKYLKDKEIIKFIHVKNKIISIVIK